MFLWTEIYWKTLSLIHLLTSTLTLSKQEEWEVVSSISLLVYTQLCFPSVAREKEWPCKFSRHLFCLTSVSDLAASLEESKDELQVAKRKNTALIKVSVSSKPSALFFTFSSKGGTRQRGLFQFLTKKSLKLHLLDRMFDSVKNKSNNDCFNCMKYC